MKLFVAGVVTEAFLVGEAVLLYYLTANIIPLALGIFGPPLALAIILGYGMWKKADFGLFLSCG